MISKVQIQLYFYTGGLTILRPWAAQVADFVEKTYLIVTSKQNWELD